MKHPHAELMKLYAEDAMETNMPWTRWELRTLKEWRELENNPKWHEGTEYRRKQKTIIINGYEVPEPIRRPLERGTMYYAVILDNADMTYTYTWHDTIMDKFLLERGFIHLAIEDATIHGKALASFTEKK